MNRIDSHPVDPADPVKKTSIHHGDTEGRRMALRPFSGRSGRTTDATDSATEGG